MPTPWSRRDGAEVREREVGDRERRWLRPHADSCYREYHIVVLGAGERPLPLSSSAHICHKCPGLTNDGRFIRWCREELPHRYASLSLPSWPPRTDFFLSSNRPLKQAISQPNSSRTSGLSPTTRPLKIHIASKSRWMYVTQPPPCSIPHPSKAPLHVSADLSLPLAPA